MSPSGRLAAEVSDDELRVLASRIATMCLEVERGLRSPDHLRAIADPRRLDRWRQELKVGRFRGGAPVKEDIGPPRLSRPTNDRALVTVITRTEGPRWGALTMDLRALGSRWRISDLQRLLAASHYRTGDARDSPVEVSLDEKIRRATDERKVVAAALAAVEQRLEDPLGKAARSPNLQTNVDALRRVVQDLDHEIAELGARRTARLQIQRLARS